MNENASMHDALKCVTILHVARMHHVHECTKMKRTLKMHYNALKCIISENAAGRKMHQNARSARTKNAAVENANKGALECMKMQRILECSRQNAT